MKLSQKIKQLKENTMLKIYNSKVPISLNQLKIHNKNIDNAINQLYKKAS